MESYFERQWWATGVRIIKLLFSVLKLRQIIAVVKRFWVKFDDNYVVYRMVAGAQFYSYTNYY